MTQQINNRQHGLRPHTEGFTIAELLIVVAIVGVLVAVAIPVFTAQLESAKEATCLANRRSMYAEVVTQTMDKDKEAEKFEELDAQRETLGYTCPDNGTWRWDLGTRTIKCSVHGQTIEDELNGFIKGQANWGDDQIIREKYAEDAKTDTWPEVIGTDGKPVYIQFKSFDRTTSGVFLYANSLSTIKTNSNRWVAQYVCDSTGILGVPGQWYEVPKNSSVAMTDTTTKKGREEMKNLLEANQNNKVNLVDGKFVPAS